MLIKTHLLITTFFVLLLFPFVNHGLVFIITALAATYIPDIDSRFSTLGRRKINRLLQVFTRHRGMTHSFLFALTIGFILSLFIPILAFGFFLGYCSHLLADSFTKDGIMPFYPFRKKSSGPIKTGGRIEIMVFVLFLIGSIALGFLRFF